VLVQIVQKIFAVQLCDATVSLSFLRAAQNYCYPEKRYAKVTNNKKGKAVMTLPFDIL
jgi:hypothetical protein